MKRLGTTFRIVLGLIGLSLGVLSVAQFLGIIPNRYQLVMQGRTALCEAIAMELSSHTTFEGLDQFQQTLSLIVDRNEELLSAGLKEQDGHYRINLCDHSKHWTAQESDISSDSQVIVPIVRGTEQWGQLELRFHPIEPPGLIGFLNRYSLSELLFFTVVGFILFSLYLRKMVTYLDPSKVIPPRVQEAFDALAEGLLMVDDAERIVLANSSFSRLVFRERESLIGMRIQELACFKDALADGKSPWKQSLDLAAPVMGEQWKIKPNEIEEKRTLLVNAAPILDEKSKARGVLISFDDITPLERKQEELNQTLTELEKSSEAIRKQNEELHFLATRDSLTGCLNRRSFFEQFKKYFEAAKKQGNDLSCVMVDVDFFKSINDTYGHSMGDLVLKEVGALLRDYVREYDPCRFGGEEFCLLLLGACPDIAAERAEQIRIALSQLEFPGFKITASLGVSSVSMGAETIQELLDQADKCLYVAKRNGRNQVVRFDTVPKDLIVDESKISRTPKPQQKEAVSVVPELSSSAVQALHEMMASRDPELAMHCKRVSELCRTVAPKVLQEKDCALLEWAALLHDFGKVAIPDAILMKPEPLSLEERDLMQQHDRLGAKLFENIFHHPGLTELVGYHHNWYNGNPANPGYPHGKDLSVAARLITIADAYDAMVADRPYRLSRPPRDAFQELQRAAGTQFDPRLVKIFVQTLSQHLPEPPIHSTRGEHRTALSEEIQARLEELSRILNRTKLGSADKSSTAKPSELATVK